MEMKGKVNHVWELFLKFVFIKDGFSMSGDLAYSVIGVTYLLRVIMPTCINSVTRRSRSDGLQT